MARFITLTVDGAGAARLAMGMVALALKSEDGVENKLVRTLAHELYQEDRNSLCNCIGWLVGQLVGHLPMIEGFDVNVWLLQMRQHLEDWIAEGMPG